jgi:hypothetical protein
MHDVDDSQVLCKRSFDDVDQGRYQWARPGTQDVLGRLFADGLLPPGFQWSSGSRLHPDGCLARIGVSANH